jgi:PAS domain S-box-containing protein
MLEQRRLLIYHLAYASIMALVVMSATLLVIFLALKGWNMLPSFDTSMVLNPFFLAMLIAWGCGLVIMVIGTSGILRASRPLVDRLDESEERNRELLDATADGVLDFDIDGKIMAFNPAAERAFGFKAEAVIGKPIGMLLPEIGKMSFSNDDPSYINGHTKLLEPCRDFLTSGIREDGDSFPVDLTVVEQIREPRSFVVVVRDLTERYLAQKELAESEERFRVLSKASLEGIVLFDGDRVVDYNQTLTQMLGRGSEDIVGASLLEYFTADSHDVIQGCVNSPEDGVFEVEAKRADGTTFACEIAVKQIPYRGRQAGVMALRDISVRKQVEAVMQQYMRSEAELSAIQKTAATYAHEINNPLTGVLGMLEMLTEEERDPERSQMLSEALICSKRIKDVMNKLSQITNAKYRPYLQHEEILDLYNEALVQTTASS